jgi:DHA1 family inner membrane transport protein
LKKAVVIGLSLSVLSYFALPFMELSLAAAVSGLAILFFIYEFTLVTSLSLCTEMLPGFRATMMSGFFAAAGIGRVLGALMGGVVWQGGGILAIGCASGTLAFLGLLCLIHGLKGWNQGEG